MSKFKGYSDQQMRLFNLVDDIDPEATNCETGMSVEPFTIEDLEDINGIVSDLAGIFGKHPGEMAQHLRDALAVTVQDVESSDEGGVDELLGARIFAIEGLDFILGQVD
jgi:hypothetical protein